MFALPKPFIHLHGKSALKASWYENEEREKGEMRITYSGTRNKNEARQELKRRHLVLEIVIYDEKP